MNLRTKFTVLPSSSEGLLTKTRRRKSYNLNGSRILATEDQINKLKAILKEIDIDFICRVWTEVDKVYETRWDCPSEQGGALLEESNERRESTEFIFGIKKKRNGGRHIICWIITVNAVE